MKFQNIFCWMCFFTLNILKFMFAFIFYILCLRQHAFLARNPLHQRFFIYFFHLSLPGSISTVFWVQLLFSKAFIKGLKLFVYKCVKVHQSDNLNANVCTTLFYSVFANFYIDCRKQLYKNYLMGKIDWKNQCWMG